MNITIPLEDFIKFITYNYLFDHVDNVPDSIVHALNYVDCRMYAHFENNTLWTIQGWINECKRRKEFAAAVQEAESKPMIKTTPMSMQELLAEFQKQLRLGNVAEANRIKQQIVKG